MFASSKNSRLWLLTFGILLVAARPSIAQDKWTVLDPDLETVPPRKMLSIYLLAEAQKHFDARKAEVAALKTPNDVRKRQAILKARMIEALGVFPNKTPLNAMLVGKEQRDGYRIEKIIYESRPHHHVTATFIRDSGFSVTTSQNQDAYILPAHHVGGMHVDQLPKKRRALTAL